MTNVRRLANVLDPTPHAAFMHNLEPTLLHLRTHLSLLKSI